MFRSIVGGKCRDAADYRLDSALSCDPWVWSEVSRGGSKCDTAQKYGHVRLERDSSQLV